jgi:hypothetical protein
MSEYHKLMYGNVQKLNEKLEKIVSRNRTIDSFADEDIPLYFRFRSKQQLHRLKQGFHFPATFRCSSGHAFTADEVLLVGLYRLHRPTTLGDACWKEVFGFSYTRVSLCFKLFITFMHQRWSYLLTDNVAFWKPYLAECAEAIRQKLGTLGCPFPPAHEPGGFKVFGFIDNTMNATCRPGGGPARDGTGAPRNDPLIQRAWYNGWKKLHGMKYQTVDLPNGMNFHVYGPVSVRHNDIFTLHHSNINGTIAQLQAGEEFQYVVYGDSAFVIVMDTHVKARHTGDGLTARQVQENRCMSSCREVIEWDYGDIGTMFSFVDYKKVLKMRKMPVAAICLTAMLFRNAYVTMNSCNTGVYFNLRAPSFETWVAGGPFIPN